MSATSDTVTVTVNGDPREVPQGLTVTGLLAHLGVLGAAAVERNEAVVPRASHAFTEVRDGDRYEVVALVGGG
ncbi:MAG: sulfur carrier protein ThiS [Polyangiales bacterium]